MRIAYIGLAAGRHVAMSFQIGSARNVARCRATTWATVVNSASFALAKDKQKKVDLAKLKPSIAEGWSGEFNTALQSWTFEKYTPGPDEMNVPNRFYLDVFPGDRPKDVEGYAKKLQKDEAENAEKAAGANFYEALDRAAGVLKATADGSGGDNEI